MASVARTMSATSRSSEPLWELHKPLEMARHRSRDALVVILAGVVFLFLVGGVLLYKGDADAMWRLADLDNLLEIEPATATMPPIEQIPSIPAPLQETESADDSRSSEETSDAQMLAAVSNGSLTAATSEMPIQFDVPPASLPEDAAPRSVDQLDDGVDISNGRELVHAEEEILGSVEPVAQSDAALPVDEGSDPTEQPAGHI